MSIPELTADCIKEVISEWTGLPIGQIGRSTMTVERLNELEDYLRTHIIGQEDAIMAIVNALRNRFLLGESNRPIGSFLFVGPSGVGKTELARSLAAYLFSNEKNLIRVDMSEYQEKFTVSRLIGSPPGYVGYNEGGQLTEAVKRQRFSAILFDEIEKAHPDVFNVLLQILDDGRLTDATGITVDFRHTVIILTSNLGNTYVGELTAKMGFHNDNSIDSIENETQKKVNAAVMEFFHPELLSRIDKVVLFRRLDFNDLMEIVKLELSKLQNRVSRNLLFSPTDATLNELTRRSVNMDSNAREVSRTVEKEIGGRLIDLISSGEITLSEQQEISIDFDTEKNFTLNINQNQAKANNELV